MGRQFEQMSGEGAKGVVEKWRNGCKLVVKSLGSAARRVAKTTGCCYSAHSRQALACNGCPYTLVALVQGFGISNGFHLFASIVGRCQFKCLWRGLGHVVTDSLLCRQTEPYDFDSTQLGFFTTKRTPGLEVSSVCAMDSQISSYILPETDLNKSMF